MGDGVFGSTALYQPGGQSRLTDNSLTWQPIPETFGTSMPKDYEATADDKQDRE
ncbi:MAG: hypothetical protein M3R17_17575 [Bacteroidota bacterium]|nr:hypothetical protein [Bacteroidota bacterium]